MLYDPKWETTTASTISPFRTAAQLRISPERHAALLKTLDFLENQLPHGHVFNMNTWKTDFDDNGSTSRLRRLGYMPEHACNTAACIGGTAEMIGKIDFKENRTAEIYELFFPHILSPWHEITQQHGAQALRNYLTTGRAHWAEVCPHIINKDVLDRYGIDGFISPKRQR